MQLQPKAPLQTNSPDLVDKRMQNCPAGSMPEMSNALAYELMHQTYATLIECADPVPGKRTLEWASQTSMAGVEDGGISRSAPAGQEEYGGQTDKASKKS